MSVLGTSGCRFDHAASFIHCSYGRGSMMESVHGTGRVSGDFAAFAAAVAKDHWPQELARLQEMSLITGAEVIYDLAMFGEEWSPAYLHGHDDPVAWINTRTKERVPGKDRPSPTA